MTLLTVLSVLALWALLLALVVGLHQIIKPLDNVRASLARIAMGVRAIEQETKPLGEGAVTMAGALNETLATAGAAAEHLAGVDHSLDAVLRA